MTTQLAVIIATFEEKEGHSSAACNGAVSDLVKFLKTKNM